MALPINTDLQFNSGAQATNFRLWNSAANPTGGTYYTGQLYYNTTDDKVYKRTVGGAWVDLTSGGGTITDVQGTLPIVSNVSSGVATISINAATTSNPGSMSAADKTKLDAATASNTVSTIMMRDGSGNTAVNMITINGTPSAGTDGVNVTFLNNTLSGFKGIRSVRAATTGVLTITGRTSTTLTVGGTSLTQDGVSLANGEVLLVKDNTTGAGGGAFDNGKYTVSGIGTSVVLTRTADMDAAGETDGHVVIVEDGTANVGTMWSMTAEVATLGTDAITWVQFNKASDITAGSGMSFTGLTLNIGAADTSITVNPDTIQVNLNATASGLEVSTGLRIKSDTVTANTIGVTIVANGAGVKFDGNSFADSGSETLALAAGVAGNGLTLTSGVLAVASGNAAIVVNANDITLTLATNSGLSVTGGLNIVSDTVTANTIGVTSTANGAGIKFNSTSFADGGSETLALAAGVAGSGLTFTTGVLSVTGYTPVGSTTVARKYVQSAVSIGSGTPVTVTHNLNTQAVQVFVMDSATKTHQLVDIVNNGVNTVQVTALGTNYNADVIVIG
jgi:hypothetical protein